jgi:chromosome segregation ATPase
MKHYHEIETYNVQLKSDIAVTKKETFTAEDNVSNLEKLKKKQDLLIDSMNEESKRLEEQKNILTAQIISQREETEEAKKILFEAEVELEKVEASKKNLLERWQKSINMMQKRDSAVQTARERLSDERETNALLLNELSGLKNEIRKEEEQTEKMGAQSSMIGKIKGSLDIIFRELRAEEEKVSAQYASLKESLTSTEQNIKLTSQEQKSVEDAMNLVEGNIMKLHTEAKRLYESLIDQKSEHTTIEKTASNLMKQAQRINDEIEEREIEYENIMNEVARIRIDQLNTKSQIELLKKKREEALAEQNDKKYLVITYEVQIKQGHDINEKKQHEVGRLNKLHDELMSKANDEGKNPEENKLINLLRESEELEQRCSEFYREWIKKQTVLVHENNKLQEIHEGVTNLSNKKMIMEQKKIRLNDSYRNFDREIDDIRISLKGLQQEMNKLNDNIAVNSDRKQKLENENVNLESEFIEKLKEMQHDATKFEFNIDVIREQKAELMNEIVECERQILLWERKYQLEQEMQEALDPNVGQSEIEELKKELHRMELRYASLLKEQSKILSEAERAIDKRETIEVRKESLVKKEPVKQKTPETTNQLKYAMKNAKENQARIMKSLQDTEKLLSKKEGELENINDSIEEGSTDLRRLENDNLALDT